MPTEDVEMLAFRVFFDYSACPQSEAGADLHILKLVLARGQCFVENVGLAVRRAVIQPHSRFDETGSLFCGDGFTRHWTLSGGGTRFGTRVYNEMAGRGSVAWRHLTGVVRPLSYALGTAVCDFVDK